MHMTYQYLKHGNLGFGAMRCSGTYGFFELCICKTPAIGSDFGYVPISGSARWGCLVFIPGG